MPWGAVSVTDLKREFCVLAVREDANICQLSRRFGIAPKTGHKWRKRFLEQGLAGLEEMSRRPHLSPGRSAPEVEQAVLEVRAAHPAWGGRKIGAVLARRGLAAPAASTVTAILQRNGCATGVFGGGTQAFRRFEHARPNDLWQMDFKGHVGLGDGTRLHPLTILDDHSRYCLGLAACGDQKTQTVQQVLTSALRRYGLPLALITDNGSPWGDGPGSPFTPLGVFLIDQGIVISHARPYHPQTMGKDERFHRSLKAEALSGTPFESLAAADAKLSRWRMVYNTQRPHEALGLAVPAERYHPSPRDFRETVEPFDYAPGDQLRRVQAEGRVSFQGRNLRLPKAFRGRDVAFRATEQDGVYEVYYRHQRIAHIDLTKACERC